MEICILAGGLSQRMGRDKSQLRLGGKTMLGHIRATARATRWPVRVIRRDLVPRCGPLGGIYTALKTTHKKAVLFLACDAPFISVELLSRLVQQFQTIPEAWFTSHQRRVGFPFILPKRSLKVVAKQLERGDLSMQSLAATVNGRRYRVPRILRSQQRNVNTPEDWERARWLWFKGKKKWAKK